jgi:membrane protease YdiL (CAAX protease family)
MRKEIVSAYGKALLLFLLIPWLIKFFIPMVFTFPLSLGFGGTQPSRLFLNIYSTAVTLIGELCYLLLSKAIEQNMIRKEENPAEENQPKSLKKVYASGFKDIVLYSLVSLTLPLLLYSLHELLGIAEDLPKINPFFSLVTLVVAPFIEEYLFRKVLYMYCKEYGIRRFVLLSALFFSLAHSYSFSVAGAILFVISYIYTYFFLATLYAMYQNIYIPIQMHICWNLTTIVIIGIFHGEKLAPAVFFTISLLILLYAIYRIIKTKQLMGAGVPA